MIRRTLLLLAAASLFLPAATIRKADSYVIPLPKGRKFEMVKQKGKVVLFCMIATTCKHCESAVQMLTRVQREFAEKGLVVVAATIEEPESNIDAFVSRYRPAFSVGNLTEDLFYKYGDIKQGERPFVPILMFIDRTGMVRHQFPGNHAFFKTEAEKNIRNLAIEMLGQ
ncbi:MAG: TlpA family protein disulfide reductase [Bryobacteraceae bacterium]|nr:TlpA family protein disulfide reductase [Bryobacteraceae bacterium]